MRIVRLSLHALVFLALVVFVWSVAIEPDRFVWREITIPLSGWDVRALRAAVLGDLHVGSPHIDLAKIDAIVVETRAAKPDVIVLLGDYVIQGVVGGTFVSPEDIAARLTPLRAPLGVYAILGNHDVWLDAARVRAALEHQGIVVLENEARSISRPGGNFWLAGIGDLATHRADLSKTLAQISNGAPVIPLSHSPDIFTTVPSRVTLTLAAHTHGGQVRLPLIGPPIVHR